MMRGNLLAFSLLCGVFLLAGEGLNLIRVHFVAYLAYGQRSDIYASLGGLLLAAICAAFLGGFIHYRDKKHGKVRREGWRGRPAKNKAQETTPAYREL